MKKTLCLLLVFLLLIPACAQGLPLLSKPFLIEELEVYKSFSYDKLTGNWQVSPTGAEGLINYFEEAEKSAASGIMAFYPSLEGNSVSGLYVPYINILFGGYEKQIGTAGIAFLLDGVRYEFCATPKQITNGKAKYEIYSIPLNQESFKLISILGKAERVSLLLSGTASFTATYDSAKKEESAQYNLLSSSVKTAKNINEIYELININTYNLWEQAIASLPENAQKSAEFYKEPLTGDINAAEGITVGTLFETIVRGSSGKSITLIQNKLIELSMLSGKADGTFGSAMQEAVKEIQTYMGLPQTGILGKALINKIMSGTIEKKAAVIKAAEEPAVTPNEFDPCEPGVIYEIDNLIKISFTGYRFCEGLLPFKSESGIITTKAENSDNILIAFDCETENISAEPIKLNSALDATITVNDVSFKAKVLTQCNSQTGFDTTLSPLTKANSVIYAEVPKAVAYGGYSISLSASVSRVTLNFTCDN